MFARIFKAATAVTLLGAAGWVGYDLSRPAYEGGAGFTRGSAYAPARDETLRFDLWYPAQPGGKEITVGGNGVFHGTPAGRAAPAREGRFPLVLISHGAGGNSGQFGWIASELAEAGFAVALPNHPGTTSGNASAEAAVRVWERPADLSAVIDAIMADPGAYPQIDSDRIAVLGFSAGGYTALAVSGARVDPDRLTRFCDGGDHGMSDCAFLARFGIDLHQMDLSPAAADLRDSRVSAAVVIDPGIVSTLTTDSLRGIDIPMLILNLGAPGDVPDGVHAYDAAQAIPTAEHAYIPEANHFSFLATCKPKGPAILEREGEPDRLCDDAGGRSRAALHRDMAARIVAYLGDAL